LPTFYKLTEELASKSNSTYHPPEMPAVQVSLGLEYYNQKGYYAAWKRGGTGWGEWEEMEGGERVTQTYTHTNK
jgi:hypothetical protein